MKKLPYEMRKETYPYRRRLRGNYVGDNEIDNHLYKRLRKRAYGTWADGYYPMKSIRGRRARPDKYKDKRKNKI